MSTRQVQAPVDPRVGGVGIEVEPAGAPLEAGPDALAAALDRGGVHVVEEDPWPASSASWAIPAPIVPAPTTPTTRAGHRQTGLIASNGWRQSAQ